VVQAAFSHRVRTQHQQIDGGVIWQMPLGSQEGVDRCPEPASELRQRVDRRLGHAALEQADEALRESPVCQLLLRETTVLTQLTDALSEPHETSHSLSYVVLDWPSWTNLTGPADILAPEEQSAGPSAG
jgi:hypothetical protein